MAPYWYENRMFRLLATLLVANGVIVVAELILSIGLAALVFSGTAQPGHWAYLLVGAVTSGMFAGQLLTLCFVGSLVERARWSMWLAVMPFALLLSIGFLAFQIGPGIEFFAGFRNTGGALEMIILFAAVVPTALCYGGVLLASVLVWPLKVFAGWRAAWQDEPDRSIGKAPISHLMVWVGLWGAFFLLATTLSESFGTVAVMAGVIGLAIIVVGGFPVMLLLSGSRWTRSRGIAVLVFILLLSWLESEFVYWIVRPSVLSSVARTLPMVLAFNGSLAGTIALNFLLLRHRGLRLHMPLPWWGRNSTTLIDGMTKTTNA